MRLLTSVLHRLLYGHFWIAACALAMYWQSRLLFGADIGLNATSVFLFSGTLALYGLHRLIGLNFVTGSEVTSRFDIIAAIRSETLIYALLGSLGAGISFFYLPRQLQLAVPLPALLSLAYALPVFRKKRLRDFPYIKIFLIALVWTWLTASLPALELGLFNTPAAWWMMAERSLFIFGITLPFDLRDRETDTAAGISTLPSIMDVRPLGLLVLLAAIACAYANLQGGLYTRGDWTAISITCLLAMIFLWLSPNVKHDYFFSGLIDGLMLLQFLGVWFL